jgi:hypothetical protein
VKAAPKPSPYNVKHFGADAYLNFWAGSYRVVTYPGQELIASSVQRRDALRRALKKGFHVRVYGESGSRARIHRPDGTVKDD